MILKRIQFPVRCPRLSLFTLDKDICTNLLLLIFLDFSFKLLLVASELLLTDLLPHFISRSLLGFSLRLCSVLDLYYTSEIFFDSLLWLAFVGLSSPGFSCFDEIFQKLRIVLFATVWV